MDILGEGIRGVDCTWCLPIAPHGKSGSGLAIKLEKQIIDGAPGLNGGFGDRSHQTNPPLSIAARRMKYISDG